MGRITGVKCTVDECVHWGTGNVCEADAIEVNTNPAAARGARGADMETGRIGERGARGAGEFASRTSEQTMCKTFRPRPAGYER
ncbi:MAG: DUF1540 domain-containing protein [Bacillota bacterium]